MMLDLDPFAEPQPPIPADPRAAERLEKLEERQAASRRRNRIALSPFLNDGIRDSEGNPATRADLKVEALRKSHELGVRLERKEAERKIRIAAFLEGPGDYLSAAESGRLHDVVDGEPRFISSLSHRQAFETGVLQLWPGGIGPGRFPNSSLKGEGATVAMWDLGGVAVAHEQFGALRVDNVDNPGAPNEHATAVATAIIGAGDPTDTDLTDFDTEAPNPLPNTPKNNARGMAYRAKLRVYNTTNDLAEMRTLAEESMAGTRDIVFSNHAYGTSCGYQRANSSVIWGWYGDEGLGDGMSDYKHGFYLSEPCRDIDEIVHTNKVFLPIWSAGNEATNFNVNASPEPQERGTAFRVAHKLMHPPGTTYTAQNAPARNQDSHTFAFSAGSGSNNLLPEACSKNVLTVSDWSGGDVGSDGPTDDLRFKPDIVCSGFGGSLSQSARFDGTTLYRQFEGSSFAAASVTGGLALVRERWLELNGAAKPVLASTWKGLAIATAGGELFHQADNFVSEGQIPSHYAGYGPFDPLDAVYVIEEDFYARSQNTGARIFEIMLKEGDDARFRIRRINQHDDFRVAICWIDPPGPQLVKSLDPRTPVLINDVDLRVIRANGDFKPWALRTQSSIKGNPGYRTVVDGETGDNTRDNVEVIDVSWDAFPEESEFTVKITHKSNLLNSDPQLVSIVIVGAAEAVLPQFRIVNFSQIDEFDPDIYGVTWLSIPGAIYQIESSSDLDSWQPLQNEISAIGDRTTTELDMAGMGNRKFIRVRRLD